MPGQALDVPGLELAPVDAGALEDAQADQRAKRGREDAQEALAVLLPARFADLLDLVAERLQQRGGVAGRLRADRLDRGRDRRGEGHRDPQPAGVAPRGLGEWLGGRRRPGGVAGLVPGEDVEDRGGVGDASRERAIEREEGVAQDGPGGDPPARGLEADQAAQVGRR